jgi:hypothetical protein
MKSTKSSIYSREFSKIDAYFSYVGGLLAAIIGLFFILGFYSETAYEVSLGRKLLLDNDKEELPSSSFNIGYYLLSIIKRGFGAVNVNLNWPKTQKYIDFCDEVCLQIDISYIVRRLAFCDAALATLMEQR